MDFLINENELAALYGLLHIQQLAYLRGIRPYMDVKTGLVGIKRGISYQSIAEQLDIEPHQGIKKERYSRMQIRRALSALESVGIITRHSEGLKLILKCELATRDFYVQNKVDPKPTQQPDRVTLRKFLVNKGLYADSYEKADLAKTPKADTPLINNNYYFYLLSQFEIFWNLYPLKNSQQKAWEQFQALNPDEQLCHQIITALQDQIQHIQKLKGKGYWVPAWKYPANWLVQQCWNDEFTQEELQENKNARQRNTEKQSDDPLWNSCKSGLEPDESSNVIELSAYRS